MMFKRIFDLFFVFLGFIVISPLFLLVVLLVKLGSRGFVFYRGIRTGLHGKPFKIFKFRTMVENAENLGGPSTGYNDPRLTKIGMFLRRSKLDEMPQLLNIIKGEMSIVGPRPQVEHYTKQYSEVEKVIFNVKPGLTDWATIEFITLDKTLGDENVDEKYAREVEPRKQELRMKYAKHHNFFIDLQIIFLTIESLFKLRSLWNTKN